MHRRIFSSIFILGILLIASFIFSHQNVRALTPTVSATPTAAPADFVGTPLSGTAPLTVQFTDISNSLITACTWNYGDGIGLTVDPTGKPFMACPSLPHTYTSAGSFTVTMHLFKADGTSATVTKTNYIQVGSSLTPTVTPDPCSSAIYTIFGHVYDAANPSLSIANASVHALTDINAEPIATTAADGTYSLSPATPYIGCHIIGIAVFANGYQTFTQMIGWQDLKAQPQRDIALVRAGTPTRT